MLAHWEATATDVGSFTKIGVKASLHMEMKEVVEVCVFPWGSYGPRGVDPRIFTW